MKKELKFVTFAFALILLTFSACKKDDPVGTNPTTPKVNEINTKLDGADWTGTILSWAVSGGTRQINANAINSSMQIFMPEDTTGTFDAADNIVTVSYNDGTTTYSNNILGSVTITANSDDHVEGEFHMVIGSYFASDTLNFTEGTFYFK